MLIYTNGCSYATVSDGKRYSDFLGDYLHCQSVNAGIVGSSNNRILRTSLRDLIQYKKSHNEIIAVISLSFLMRTEVWDITHKEQKWRESGDGDFFSVQFTEDKNWISLSAANRVKQLDKQYKELAINWLEWYNVEAKTTELLQNLILFSSWCNENNVRYVIFSGPLQESIDFTAPFVYSFYEEVNKNKNIINIFEQSFLEWCTQQGFNSIDHYNYVVNGHSKSAGHQGEAAHLAWANYLLDNYLTNSGNIHSAKNI